MEKRHAVVALIALAQMPTEVNGLFKHRVESVQNDLVYEKQQDYLPHHHMEQFYPMHA